VKTTQANQENIDAVKTPRPGPTWLLKKDSIEAITPTIGISTAPT
jgi:hypothetical protein